LSRADFAAFGVGVIESDVNSLLDFVLSDNFQALQFGDLLFAEEALPISTPP
jgi:hypothetical protein